MADIRVSLRRTLKHEGVRFDKRGNPTGRTGYINHPADPGKATNYGIRQSVARRWGYKGSMRRIPYVKVLDIYTRRYWNRLRLSDVPSQAIANELFDTCVNCGTHRAGMFLQRVLNVFNNRQKRYRDIAVDGKVGPATIRTLKRALRYPRLKAVLLKALNCLQGAKYITIAEGREKSEVFMLGWFSRVE